MAGTREGGRKAAAKNKENNPNFFRIIGAKGGSSVKPENRPFAMDRKLAARAGKIGGEISRRT